MQMWLCLTSRGLMGELSRSSTTSRSGSHCRATHELPGRQLKQLCRLAVAGNPSSQLLTASDWLAASPPASNMFAHTS